MFLLAFGKKCPSRGGKLLSGIFSASCVGEMSKRAIVWVGLVPDLDDGMIFGTFVYRDQDNDRRKI